MYETIYRSTTVEFTPTAYSIYNLHTHYNNIINVRPSNSHPRTLERYAAIALKLLCESNSSYRIIESCGRKYYTKHHKSPARCCRAECAFRWQTIWSWWPTEWIIINIIIFNVDEKMYTVWVELKSCVPATVDNTKIECTYRLYRRVIVPL